LPVGAGQPVDLFEQIFRGFLRMGERRNEAEEDQQNGGESHRCHAETACSACCGPLCNSFATAASQVVPLKKSGFMPA
jgi:hypothetical protein